MSVQSNIFNTNRTQTVKQEILTGTESTKLETMGLGMEMRIRPNNYPEIIGVPKSIYYQTDNISPTERSFGMPTGSSQDIYSRLTGTSGSGLQISSTSTNDVSAGTGAITIYINGFFISGNNWFNRSTYSTPTTLTGQTAVQIGTDTDWYRINKIWVLTAGSNETNVGDLYISPIGQSLTNGVPDGNILCSVLAGFSNSTGGYFSIGTDRRFNYTKGNFWLDPTKSIRVHEIVYQDLNGSANTADMVKYEVGQYPSITGSFDYSGASPYTEKSDIGLTIFTTSGTADIATYYVEYVLTNNNKSN